MKLIKTVKTYNNRVLRQGKGVFIKPETMRWQFENTKRFSFLILV